MIIQDTKRRLEVVGSLEAKPYADLLDLCFEVPPGCHYLDDFPVWNLDSGIQASRLGLCADGRLISTASLRVAQLKTGDPIGVIGAVATHPEFRGHGFASRLIKELVENAKDLGVAQLILWSSDHAFYARLGFYPQGGTLRARLRDLRILPQPQVAIKMGWTDALFPLLRERSDRFLLTAQDLRWFRRHRNVIWYWMETNGTPFAYVGLGRGIDLQNVVHEWGGDRDYLLSLFNFVLRENPEAQIIGCERDLAEIFGPQQIKLFIEEPLCLVRHLSMRGESLKWIWGLDAC